MYILFGLEYDAEIFDCKLHFIGIFEKIELLNEKKELIKNINGCFYDDFLIRDIEINKVYGFENDVMNW